jgi:hypothetical protein
MQLIPDDRASGLATHEVLNQPGALEDYNACSDVAICCNLLFGYSLRSKARAKLLVVLPIVISIAFMLVADIDTPRHGIVRVSPQNLTSLAESLCAQ